MSGVKQVLKDVLFGERQPRYSSTGTTGIVTPPSTPTTIATNIPISAEAVNLGGEQVKTDVEVLRRPPVVREVIHPLEKHEVSPVIYREREKTEIRQVEQPIYETIQKPTLVREASLPAETRPVVQAQTGEFDLKYKEGIQNYPQPSVSYAPIEKEVITKPPVVIETVRKHVKEEIQPVIYREVLQQEVIRETKPIYEKIVEAPSLIRVQAQPLYETRGLQENLPQITTGYPSSTMGGTIPVSGTTGGQYVQGSYPMGVGTTTTTMGGTIPVSGTTEGHYVQGSYPMGVGATTTTMLPGGGLRETKVTLTEAQRGSSSHWNTSSS